MCWTKLFTGGQSPRYHRKRAGAYIFTPDTVSAMERIGDLPEDGLLLLPGVADG
ncbi:hypothetical protein [Acidipila sp. EB88]|uniref:hypothetical protein n=1 Tax=Acidipila sp. EB88 TaxID=2305226 RepID=UPI001315A597|nr:hypothetical protein [Acidipila sp. EB88]